MTRAVIVAAGEGKRLLPASKGMPKCLLWVGDKPLIQYSLEALKTHGIERVAIVIGYEGRKIRDSLGDAFTYILNPFYAVTNNMASLWFAKEFVSDADFLYLHADLLYHPNILPLLLDHTAEISLAVKRMRCGKEEMKVIVEDDHFVESSKDVDPKDAYGEWIGIARFSPRGWNRYLPEAEALMLEGELQAYDTKAMTRLARMMDIIRIADIENLPYIEIDSMEDLERARSEVLNAILDSPGPP